MEGVVAVATAGRSCVVCGFPNGAYAHHCSVCWKALDDAARVGANAVVANDMPARWTVPLDPQLDASIRAQKDALRPLTRDDAVRQKRHALARHEARRRGETLPPLEPDTLLEEARVRLATLVVAARPRSPPASLNAAWTLLACMRHLPKDLRCLLYLHYVRAQYGGTRTHEPLRRIMAGGTWVLPSDNVEKSLPCIDLECRSLFGWTSRISKLSWEAELAAHFVRDHAGVAWTRFIELHATCPHSDLKRMSEEVCTPIDWLTSTKDVCTACGKVTLDQLSI